MRQGVPIYIKPIVGVDKPALLESPSMIYKEWLKTSKDNKI